MFRQTNDWKRELQDVINRNNGHHAREKITAAYFGSSAVMRRKVARRPQAVGADDPDST